MKDDNCIFCKIVDGSIPSSKVYEDEQVIAFLDISPVNKGHTLIVPKTHSKNLLLDDLEDLTACMNAIQKVGKAVMDAVKADGFNLGCNTNKAAGQAVMHTHFHIIPRYETDDLKHWPQGKYEGSEMAEVKESIITALKRL